MSQPVVDYLCCACAFYGAATSNADVALTSCPFFGLQFEADANAYGVKRITRTASNASSLDTVGTEYTDGDSSIAADDSR